MRIRVLLYFQNSVNEQNFPVADVHFSEQVEKISACVFFCISELCRSYTRKRAVDKRAVAFCKSFIKRKFCIAFCKTFKDEFVFNLFLVLEIVKFAFVLYRIEVFPLRKGKIMRYLFILAVESADNIHKFGAKVFAVCNQHFKPAYTDCIFFPVQALFLRRDRSRE